MDQFTIHAAFIFALFYLSIENRMEINANWNDMH